MILRLTVREIDLLMGSEEHLLSLIDGETGNNQLLDSAAAST